MIITIAGKPGSGKSTVGKMLATELRYRFFSIGDLRGQMAMKRGLTIDELNELGKTEHWTDLEVDKFTQEMGRTADNLVIDGRLAWYFIPQSFKIYLDVVPAIAAQRIFPDQRPDEEPEKDVTALNKRLDSRYHHDQARYHDIYQVDINNMSNYDLILDTSDMPVAEIVAKIIDKLPKNN